MQGDTRIDTLLRLARALGVPTDALFEPNGATKNEDVMDPRLEVMMHLIEDMTPEERESVERYVRFVRAERMKRPSPPDTPKRERRRNRRA